MIVDKAPNADPPKPASAGIYTMFMLSFLISSDAKSSNDPSARGSQPGNCPVPALPTPLTKGVTTVRSVRLFASGRGSRRALLEDRSASIAQFQFSLPQAALNLGGVGDVIAAKPECVRCTCGSLLRRSTSFLSKSDRVAGAGCGKRDRDKILVRHSSLPSTSL